MYKFIKTRDEENDYDKTAITFEVDAIGKDVLLEEFGHFLKACGFHINGTIDIVEEEWTY